MDMSINLDQPDDVRIAAVDEVNDPVQISLAGTQIAVRGKDRPDPARGSGSVCDIVNQKPHSLSCMSRSGYHTAEML